MKSIRGQPGRRLRSRKSTFTLSNWPNVTGRGLDQAGQFVLVKASVAGAIVTPLLAAAGFEPRWLAVLLCAEPGPGRQKVALHRQPGGAEPRAVSMMAAFLAWWFGSEARLELRTERTTWAWERY